MNHPSLGLLAGFLVAFVLPLQAVHAEVNTPQLKALDTRLRAEVTAPHHNSLSLQNADHFNYIEATLDCGGINATTRPAQMRRLNAVRAGQTPPGAVRQAKSAAAGPAQRLQSAAQAANASVNERVPINIVENITSTGGNNYTTTTLTTFNATADDLVSVNVSIYMSDADGNRIGPCQSGSWHKTSALNDNNVTLTTTGTASSGTQAVFTRGVYVANFASGATVPGQFFAEHNPQVTNAGVTLTNDAPADLNGDGQIKICTFRINSDCDYCYLPQNAGNCTYVVPPITGEPSHSFITFPVGGAIEMPSGQTVTYQSDNKTPQGAKASLVITDKNNGGCVINYNTANFFNASADVLSNQTPQGFSWTIDPTKFGIAPACLVSGSAVYFDFNMQIQTSVGPVLSYIGNNGGTGAGPSVPLGPMQIVYGCLRDGTQVTLADGAKVAIQDAPIGGRIRGIDASGQPQEVIVSDIIKGLPETIYVVRLANDREVGMTQGHGVLLVGSDTPKAAAQLKPGDVLRTSSGTSEVVSITKREQDAPVWNLKLKANTGTDVNTLQFLADDVLVGGARMQQVAEAALRRAPVVHQEHLHEEWHQDFLNAQAEQRAADR